jgi:flagellar basal-body rod modification protein FlgD
MTTPNPIFNNGLTPPTDTQLNTTSSSSADSSNTLGPDSFITLLTAQLQAQDPLNPMDPSQMVDQLTEINSLQQLIQIQSDLQTALGLPQASTGTTGSTTPTTPAS